MTMLDDALHEAHKNFVNLSTCIKALSECVLACAVIHTFYRHPHRLDKLDQSVDDPIMQSSSVIPRDTRRGSDAITIRIDDCLTCEFPLDLTREPT